MGMQHSKRGKFSSMLSFGRATLAWSEKLGEGGHFQMSSMDSGLRLSACPTHFARVALRHSQALCWATYSNWGTFAATGTRGSSVSPACVPEALHFGACHVKGAHGRNRKIQTANCHSLHILFCPFSCHSSDPLNSKKNLISLKHSSGRKEVIRSVSAFLCNAVFAGWKA